MPKADWVFALKNRTPRFLNKLQGRERPGFFHYSLSGDLYSEKKKWGLGNTVFAVKIYYTLNHLASLPLKKKRAMARFIQSFQRGSGLIFDPLIFRNALLRNLATSLKELNPQNIWGTKTKYAETRQALNALKLLGKKPHSPLPPFIQNKIRIQKYLDRLNWQQPWDAGSHFSHLIFFLQNSPLTNKKELINFAWHLLQKIQNPHNGSWYQGKPSLRQKINGAMKVLTGIKTGGIKSFSYPEKLIDLCLNAPRKEQACDILNTTYVLYYACRQTECQYRLPEIKRYAQQTLNLIYHNYYFPRYGGFSFLPGKANTHYYGAHITRGLPEPDIHGTCLLLWATTLLARILGLSQKLNFQEPKP